MPPKANKSKGKATKPAADFGDRIVAKNRRARFDYELGDGLEAGLVLIGSEVRALREGSADLSEAWVDISRGEAWVKGMRIPTLKHAAFAHEEKRPRKLLLHSSQIEKLRIAQERERMAIVATKLYFKNGRAKLEIATGRGKKLHDKRQTLRERDANKEARDAIRAGKGYGR
jgi:SsrA-binding protein